MAELIQNGVPSDISALQGWNAFKTSVKTDSTYGYVYAIESTGFMNQFVTVGEVLNSCAVSIEFRNAGADAEGTITIQTAEGENINAMFLLSGTDGYQTLKYDIATPSETRITSLAFEVRNTTGTQLNIAGISIQATIESTMSVEDMSDFMQKCIMFGLDVMKPDVR